MSPLGAIDSQSLMAESQVLRGQHRVRHEFIQHMGTRKRASGFQVGITQRSLSVCLCT